MKLKEKNFKNLYLFINKNNFISKNIILLRIMKITKII